ncbi:MAG: ATP-binding protein [Myxococcota bacterium]
MDRPADEGSAGVKLLIYFIVLAWLAEPPGLILVEEPETGLHPQRLAEVMGLLRGLTEGRHAPQPVQVVLTTHSPYLLDSVDPATDQVLVFSRRPDGSCTAAPLDAASLAPFLRDFGLGELWTNEGEARLVGR